MTGLLGSDSFKKALYPVDLRHGINSFAAAPVEEMFCIQFFSVPLNVLSRDADTLPLAIKPVERLEVIQYGPAFIGQYGISWITVAIQTVGNPSKQPGLPLGCPSDHHSVGAGGTQYLPRGVW